MQHWIHDLDPVIFSFGPLAVRWYGLMYLLGFVCGYFLFVRRWKRGLFALNPEESQMLLTYLMISMMIGARLVYVTVYDPWNYIENPGDIFAIWKGGLSYHGAVLGFVVAVILVGKKLQVSFFHIMDNVVIGGSLGVFFGRIGNFINGELAGRTTDAPWGIVFPAYGSEPRHPSQLYQAFGEGLSVLVVLLILERIERRRGMAPQPVFPDPEQKNQKPVTVIWKRVGILSSSYLIIYGIARFIVEFFRQPDSQLGFFADYFSMGQILCTLMMATGAFLLYRNIKRPTIEEYTIIPQK